MFSSGAIGTGGKQLQPCGKSLAGNVGLTSYPPAITQAFQEESLCVSNRRIERELLEPSFARLFIGGRGFTSRVLFNHLEPGIDPLCSENVLCLGAGPLSGTSLPMSSRIQVGTLSPYSGILGDGNAGGGFAYRLKRAGYDLLVIKGRAEAPVYLLIENDAVQLIDASDLWGGTTWRTTDLLHQRHGAKVSVAAIGQAGENLVRMASTIVDRYASAARGSGAVWGSKNLKAIVVSGSGRVPLADPDAFERMTGEDRAFFLRDPAQRGIIAVYGSHIGMMSWSPGWRYFEKRLEPHEVPGALTPEGLKRFETGAPTRRRLVELDLEDVADTLEGDTPGPRWEGPPLRPLNRYPSGGHRA